MPDSSGSAENATLTLKLVKSPIGSNARQRATVQAQGLRKMQQVVVQVDTPVASGKVEEVSHLVQIEEE